LHVLNDSVEEAVVVGDNRRHSSGRFVISDDPIQSPTA